MAVPRFPATSALRARWAPASAPALAARFHSLSTWRPELRQLQTKAPRQPAAASPIAPRWLSSGHDAWPGASATQPPTAEASSSTTASPLKERRHSIDITNRTWPKALKLPKLWLRDSCTCTTCVDPDSGQKNFATTDLADTPEVKCATLAEDGSLVVEWAEDPLPHGNGLHLSTFSAETLNKWAWDKGERISNPFPRILWNRQKYEELIDQCRVTYNDWLNDDEAFWAAFQKLAETGLIFVRDVPKSETEVEKIANRIGMLQHTFYGWTWDVRSKPRAENVAYTSKFLGLHQDLMYHSPIPKLQLLHCLENSCEGGESLFSDGIHAAHELFLHNRRAFEELTSTPVPYHYKKGGHDYFAALPVLALERTHTTEDVPGFLERTHWAPPFQGPFKKPEAEPGRYKNEYLRPWRESAIEFQMAIESTKNMVELKLQPGECVIFDNTRVLHGRRQFATAEGSRWLKGTYVSHQVFQGVENRLKERIAYEKLYRNVFDAWNVESRQVKHHLKESKQKVGNQSAPESEPESRT